MKPQELLAEGCRRQDPERVERALAQGAAPDLAGDGGSPPPVELAVESWRRRPTPMLKEILILLGKAGARAPEIDQLLFFDAIDTGDADRVAKVLGRGVEVDDLNEGLPFSRK